MTTLARRAPAVRASALPPLGAAEAPRPLHVAFALGGTDLGRSGIGTYIREVLPPLIAQLEREGSVLTAFGHPSELEAYGTALAGARRHVAPVTATRAGVNALWHLTSAAAFSRRLGADVLLLPAANRRVIARSGIASVAVVHDLAQLRVRDKYDRLRMFYFRHVLLRALRTPTRLVAVSEATRADVLDAVGVPANRVDVVYNGVNPRVFAAAQSDATRIAQARRELGLEARPYLLYPARLEHPGKNHLRLLRAFAQSGLAGTHTLALSGGDWGALPQIQNDIRALQLDAHVRLLGFVPAEQLAALVAGADAVLMLGLHEGFGLPALEALSAGRPVCVANTGALPEVVGPLGVRCDPFQESAIAEGLRRAIVDEPVRARCKTEGPAWAAQFTWTRTAAGLVTACRAAVDVAAPR